MFVRGMAEGVLRMIPLTIIPLTSLLSALAKADVSCADNSGFGCGWPRCDLCVLLRPVHSGLRLRRSGCFVVNSFRLRLRRAAALHGQPRETKK